MKAQRCHVPDRFWITLLLSLPTLLWSAMVQHMFGFSAPAFPGSSYIPAFFGTAVYVYGGSVFLKGGLQELRDRLPGMMTLISLRSPSPSFQPGGDPRLSRRGVVVGAGLTHHHHAPGPLDRDAIDLAGVRRPTRTRPAAAQHRATPDRRDDRRLAISALRDADLVLVRPGASVPADGIVQSGKSDVNESMITGDRFPWQSRGAKVIAGTVNGSGSLRVQVTGTANGPRSRTSCDWWNRRRLPAPVRSFG